MSDFWSAWSFRQTVELPSEEREKDEIGKDGNSHYLHSGFSWDKQTGNHAHKSDHPEDYAHPPEASAKIWSAEHGPAEDDETHRHEEAPDEEERVRYALGRLPQKDDRCLRPGCRRRSLVKVGDWGEGKKRGRISMSSYDVTYNAQHASKESERQVGPPEGPIQGQDEGDRQKGDRHHQNSANPKRRSDVGEPHQPFGCKGIYKPV